MTNGDKIRLMNNKELAEFFNKNDCCAFCSHFNDTSCGCFIRLCDEGFDEYINQEIEE